jgi:hypothetical protein
MYFAEHADCSDAFAQRPADRYAAIAAEQVNQSVELIPPASREPAVAPTGTATTDVLFENEDVNPGMSLGQVIGRPQNGVTPSDDNDVSGVVAVNGRQAGWVAFRCKSLPKPPAPSPAGNRDLAPPGPQRKRGRPQR